MLTSSVKDGHVRLGPPKKTACDFGGVLYWPVDEKQFCQAEPENFFLTVCDYMCIIMAVCIIVQQRPTQPL